MIFIFFIASRSLTMKKKSHHTPSIPFFFLFVSLPFYFKYIFFSSPVGMKSHDDSSSFVTHADAADRQSQTAVSFFFFCAVERIFRVCVFFIGSLNDLFNVSLHFCLLFLGHLKCVFIDFSPTIHHNLCNSYFGVVVVHRKSDSIRLHVYSIHKVPPSSFPVFFGKKLGAEFLRARGRAGDEIINTQTDVIHGVASVVGRFPPNRHKGLKLLALGME